MKESMDNAWDYVWNRLFCEKTDLFYDYLVSDAADAATCHLPPPETIALQVPNPCGWSTGMEDSMTYGGIMLDTVVARYNATGDGSPPTRLPALLRSLYGRIVYSISYLAPYKQ
jgi:hypothetical protein